jgi:type IV pilus assembly protein PilE
MLTGKSHTIKVRRLLGFTLIELLIVAAIVAILAVIAYPSFIEQVRKSRRQEAISLISQIAQAQERWRGSCPTYATLPNTATAAFPNNCTVATSGLGVLNPSSGYYTASIASATASSYTISAIASGAQASDTRCTRLTLTMTDGNAAYTATPAANNSVCWSR